MKLLDAATQCKTKISKIFVVARKMKIIIMLIQEKALIVIAVLEVILHNSFVIIMNYQEILVI